MLPDKVAIVRDRPKPKNMSELRTFVRLCSYYPRFISDFATIAAPLHEETRKNVAFKWAEAQEKAFDSLKEKLTPVLGMPKDDGTFYLDTDASDTGLGAVSSQEQDDTRECLLTRHGF